MTKFLIFLLCLFPLACRGSTAFEGLLQRADHTRSSSPQEFQRLLDQLDAQVQDADPQQRQRLQYLHAYSMLASADRFRDGIAAAKRIFDSATDPELKFRAGMLVANSGAISRNFGEGLQYLERSMAFRSMVRDKEIRNDGINVAAVLYNQIGQFSLGLRYAEETLADHPGPRALCFAHHLEIEAQYNLGELPESDAPIFAAVEQCDAAHEPIVANLVRANLARKWMAAGRVDGAKALLSSHLNEVNRTGYPRLIIEIESLLSELRLQSGDLVGAESAANLAISQKRGLDSVQPIVNAYKTLFEVAERRKDFAGALGYYKLYDQANVAYLGDVKARELAYHLVRQEALQKNQQIELLNRQNSLLQLQQRVEKQRAESSRLLMLLFAVFTLVIAYWGYKTRRLHASLRLMAETDALTGICNRHYFTAQAEKTLSFCARAGEQVSLIMFDLDHFKTINDSYGHVTGDWVLKEVAKTCAELCRRMDYFGRLGGEEFAILLHGCDQRAATRIAEDCRMRIARIKTLDSGYNFQITASFGVSCSTVAAYDLDKLMSLADQMLYRAKREGRNRVRAFAHDLPAETREPAPQRDDDAHDQGVEAVAPLWAP